MKNIVGSALVTLIVCIATAFGTVGVTWFTDVRIWLNNLVGSALVTLIVCIATAFDTVEVTWFT